MTDTADTSAPGAKLDTFVGAALMVLGIVLLANPAFGSLAVTKLVGWIFIFSGITTVIAAVAGHVKSRFWSLIGGAAVTTVGVLLAFNPLKGSITLTFLFVLWLLFEGATTILAALFDPRARFFMIMVGGINLALGLILWSDFPTNAAWLLGVFGGISLIMRGMLLLIVGRMRSITPIEA